MQGNNKEADDDAGQRVRALLAELTAGGSSRDRVLSLALAEVAYCIAAERSPEAAIEALALTAGAIDLSARSGSAGEAPQPAGQAYAEE